MSDPNHHNPRPTVDPHLSSSNKVPKGGGYPNPADTSNPDASTLREQWRFATRQYRRWYAHAWGTAFVAGISFFALGWIIKGHNPLESFKTGISRKGDDSDQQDKKG